MKSKAEVLKNQKIKKNEELKKYVELMEKTISRKYPNGLDFDECPHCERFVYYRDVDIDFCTGYEKIIIKAIEQTKVFRQMSKELRDNGWTFELVPHVDYSKSSPEWRINLVIS